MPAPRPATDPPGPPPGAAALLARVDRAGLPRPVAEDWAERARLPGAVVVSAHGPDGPDGLVGWAQAEPDGDRGWRVEAAVEPGPPGADMPPDVPPEIPADLLVDLLTDLLGRLAAAPGGPGAPVAWWAFGAGPGHQRAARSLGLTESRAIHQLRRALPVEGPEAEEAAALPVRAFRPGRDDDAWLRVNNRAFAWHPEQGGWDHEQLAARVAEPWFDPEGFLLHERDGRLAGFCWTREHPDERPPMGEIYVIGVDPDFQGLGLGRALVVAGLAHLHRRGLEVGSLYVEADNEPALALYRDLGFAVHHTDRVFTGTVPATTPKLR